MKRKYISTPILICIAAIVLNLCGMFVARTFELSIYLDTIGTILVAMMSGYIPGIVVGFTTHILASFVNESEMYFCSVNIFVAIYITFLARRGFYKTFFKALLTIPVLALMATILSEFIGRFLFCTGVIDVLSQIQLHFATIFLQELADKSLSVIVAFALLNFLLPPYMKKIFQRLGQRQAPLTDEMKHAVYGRKCPTSSLRVKILLILTLTSLFIAGSIASISYRIFEQSAIAVQIKIGESLATIAARDINKAKDSADIEESLDNIKDANHAVKSLRVEKFSEERPLEPIISDEDNNRHLTLYKPIYGKAGNIQYYVVIELSLEWIDDYGRTFTAKVLALFSGCFVFVFVIGLRFVENNIVLPVNTMAYCAENFAYDSDKVCESNVEQIQSLKIRTGDEIENLYHALLKTTQDVMNYLEKLRRARKQVAELDLIAHKDSLTGINNKAAYDETTALIDEKISEGDAEFCIIMVDVNYLKRVNDTYGHERGNEYLMNACRLICAVFGEEHVYRVGGDEFVVILMGDKGSLGKYFVKQFNAEMSRKNASKSLEPWEKISAAVGLATYQPNIDKTADEVFKRADKEMYKNKLAMKAARTD